MNLDNIDNAELLTADEIEERLADVQNKRDAIEYKQEILRRSPGISDKYCNEQIISLNEELSPLLTDIQAYQTALDAVPEDYK